MVDFNGIHIGTVWEALVRLSKLATGGMQEVGRYLKRIIDDPPYRRQVFLAMKDDLVISEISQDDWIGRESNALKQTGIEVDAQTLEEAWQDDFTSRHYFLPGGLSRSQLLEIAGKVGIKLYSNPDCDGEKLSTQKGVLECDLSKIMTPSDAQHRPFNLNYEEQEAWVKKQGGDGLTSVEEFLYLLIRAFLQFRKIPYMGGWCRCRNRQGSVFSLGVDFSAGYGLGVSSGALGYRFWGCGALARKFSEI